MAPLQCFVCKGKAAGSSPDIVRCSVCEVPAHVVCISKLPIHGEDENDNWTCNKCVSVPTVTEAFNSIHFEKIMQQLTVLTSAVTESTSKISQMNVLLLEQGTAIGKCLDEVASLRQENNDLKTKIATLETKVNNNDITVLYPEIKERVEREKNIIINGINENCDNVRLYLNNIMQHINTGNNSGDQYNITNHFRIGKRTPNKIRPIKVQFGSSEEAYRVLRNKSKMDLTLFPGINIKSDLTRLQRQELNEMVKEINSDPYLTIKYINRQPKIVRKSQPIENNDAPKRARDESISPRGGKNKKHLKSTAESSKSSKQ